MGKIPHNTSMNAEVDVPTLGVIKRNPMYTTQSTMGLYLKNYRARNNTSVVSLGIWLRTTPSMNINQ